MSHVLFKNSKTSDETRSTDTNQENMTFSQLARAQDLELINDILHHDLLHAFLKY